MPTEAFREPKEDVSWGEAWPSERTWEMCAFASAALEIMGLNDALGLGAIIGNGPALAYVGWRAKQDLPDPETVLAAPDTFPLPKEDDRLFVVLCAVVGAAVTQANPTKWLAAWQVCGRAAKSGQRDVATVAARVLSENMPPNIRPPKIAAEFIPFLEMVRRK